jgi:hypothetical protein
MSPARSCPGTAYLAAMTVQRRKLRPEVSDLGALRLYREDLRAIAATINERGTLQIFCYEGDSMFEASDLADFDKTLPESPYQVTISNIRSASPHEVTATGVVEATTVSAPEVTATFWQWGANVELFEPDTWARGVLSGIQAICRPRRRRMWSFCRRFGGPIAACAALVLLFIVIAATDPQASSVWHNVFLNSILPVTLLALIPVGIGMRLLTRSNKVIIINALKTDRPSYWDRTRDIWVVGIITAVAGAVLGYALGKIT